MTESLAARARAEELFDAQLVDWSEHLVRELERLRARHPELALALAELERACFARLLSSDGPTASFGACDEPKDDEPLARLATRAPSEARYRVVGEVARGGMGVILEAWDTDLRRTLAMKVLLDKQGKASERALARFLDEAQVTGQLDHPGVVPVHELGVDASGRAFFTMRLVRGETLSAVFTRVRRGEDGWSTTRAVGVLLKACEALAYAHEKGVIHRDLKPANVMVGRFGEVYVMDWGLARVLGQDDKKDVRVRRVETRHVSTLRPSDSPLMTMDGDVVGTPAYMSPEQARGELARMGPASDVYSLGAILYELLAGHMPYVPPGSETNALRVWARVQERAPEPLRARAPNAPAELIAVCDKAMAREPEARYASMLELAADLRAWLEGRVVRAHRTGVTVEVVKWMQRNRGLAAALAAALFLLPVGAVTSSAVLARKNEALRLASDEARTSALHAVESEQGMRAQRDRADESAEHARREAQTSQRVVAFLQDTFALQLPEHARGETITIEQALDRAASRIAGQLADEPEIRARLVQVMGDLYTALGLYGEAEPLSREAFELQRRELGDEHARTLASANHLAWLWIRLGRLADAEPLCLETLAAHRRSAAVDPGSTWRALDNLATLRADQRRYAEAEPLFLELLEGRQAALGDDHDDTLLALNNLATLYVECDRLDDAESLFRAALAGWRRRADDTHPSRLTCLANLAGVYASRHLYRDAEPLYREALAGHRRVHGDDHPYTLNCLRGLAQALSSRGEVGEAESILSPSIEAHRRALGAEHPDTLRALGMLASVHHDAGRYAQAEPLYLEVLAARRRTLGADHPDTLDSAANLGALYQDTQRYAEAEVLLLESSERERRAHGELHVDTLKALNNLATLRLRQGRLREAEELYRQALLGFEQVAGADSPLTLGALRNLGGALFEQRRLDEAEPLYREALEGLQRVAGDDDAATWVAKNSLAALYSLQGRHAEAEPLYLETLASRRRALGADHPNTRNSMWNLARLYQTQGRLREAEPLARELVERGREGDPMRADHEQLLRSIRSTLAGG